MKVLLFALLAAISYAQTAGGAAAGGASSGAQGMDPMMWGMYDELMDFGDMYPEVGDLYDNMYDSFYPMMQNMGIGGSSGAGGATGAGGLAGMMGQLPFMGGDLQDMMSDVVDNMKDGDIVDVMENLLPMSQMGLPGLDMNSIMSNGMPDLSGIMQGLSPYLAMDGDFYGDLGDLYNFGSDLFEDYFKYGGMGGMQGMPDMSGIMGMMGGMGESPMLRKARAARLHKKLRRRRPSRLLKKTRTSRKLRKPREFPFFAFNQPQQSGTGGKSSTGFPFFGFDAPDSEDIQNFLMMGGDRSRIPPPLDGIDMEDMWMYRGTQWDPMRMFNKITGQASASGSNTQSNSQPNNMWLWSLLSGLQKAHMQRKH